MSGEKRISFNDRLKVILKAIWIFIIKLFNMLKPSLIAISIGLLFGFIIMLFFNPSGAFSGLLRMLSGGLEIGSKGVGDLLLRATPIILTGLSLVVAFKTGLFNIGTPGQMIVGAFVAVYIGVLWTLPAPLHWIVALLLGTLAGAVWGSIPGLLKAFANTNEVVSSIMLNYIATYLVVFLIKTTSVYNFVYSKSLNIKATAEITRFGNLFANSKVNVGIIIAILAGVIIHYLFKKTTLGYELKASGYNKNASRYAGMNAKRNIVLSMVIAGALAGLAGAIQYLVIGTNLGTTYSLLPEGFDGISVALLGQTQPIGSVVAGLFLSYIRQGGFFMQVDGFPTQIIDIIIAVIIYVTSITMGIQIFIKRLKDKRRLRLLEDQGGV